MVTFRLAIILGIILMNIHFGNYGYAYLLFAALLHTYVYYNYVYVYMPMEQR